jgi:hypothetical protein
LSDPHNAQLVANAMAESYVDDVHDWIDAGHSFTPQYGHLQQATNWRPKGGGVAEVYILDQTFQNYNEKLEYRFDANPAGYAWFVEKGTGPHVINPKAGRNGLKIPVSGGDGYIIRRSVNHPGSKAHPFFFADMDNRKQHMLERGRSVLASRMAQAGGGHG